MADNDRVTTREFYDALLDQNDRMDETERRILKELGAIRACFNKEKLINSVQTFCINEEIQFPVQKDSPALLANLPC